MPSRRHLLGLLAALPFSSAANAQEKLPVVASFSILGDLVRAVGGERVAVTVLVGPGGDAHVYAPTPADAKAVAAARLVIANGLGFEGWMRRLLQSAGAKAPLLEAAKGAAAVADKGGHGHSHGAADPHAWQSVANAKLYAANIRDALVAADPAGKAAYEANAAAYLAELDVLEAEIRREVAALPAERRRVITSHEAFGHFQAAYGIRFIAPRGISTEAEASAQDMARLIQQIRREKVPAVFLETISDQRLVQQIARETGAALGGTLFSDSLSPPDGPAPTYIRMMRHNIRTIAAALRPAS